MTLIDQSDRFVFKPLLYDYVAGSATAWEVAPYFQQLLAPYNINFLQAGAAPPVFSASAGFAACSQDVGALTLLTEASWHFGGKCLWSTFRACRCTAAV